MVVLWQVRSRGFYLILDIRKMWSGEGWPCRLVLWQGRSSHAGHVILDIRKMYL